MPEFFYQCWAHSYEEDADAVTISKTYRPCNYKEFNPSMYRHRIEFFRDGRCKTLQLAANDAHFYLDAFWQYKKGNVFVRNDKKEIILKFSIRNLKNNRLDIVLKKFN